MSASIRPVVNAEHPRQDIGRTREFDPHRLRYEFAVALLPPAAPGAALLDVGGGAGEFCVRARALGYRTKLVDGNASSVAAERGRGGEAVVLDLTRGLAGLPDATFDAVVCLEVIEHIVTAELLLAEMARVLRPGGVLVLSTPNFGFLKDRLAYLAGENAKEEGYHFRFFTRRKLEAMAAAVGLEVEARSSIGSAMGVNFVLRIITLGTFRFRPFRCPAALESWLAMTFVWRLRHRGAPGQGEG